MLQRRGVPGLAPACSGVVVVRSLRRLLRPRVRSQLYRLGSGFQGKPLGLALRAPDPSERRLSPRYRRERRLWSRVCGRQGLPGIIDRRGRGIVRQRDSLFRFEGPLTVRPATPPPACRAFGASTLSYERGQRDPVRNSHDPHRLRRRIHLAVRPRGQSQLFDS